MAIVNECSAQEIRVSEVREYLNELSDAIEMVGQAVPVLHKKISPVLRPSSEEKADVGHPVPVLCPLADEIRAKAWKVNEIGRAISNLINSVEV